MISAFLRTLLGVGLRPPVPSPAPIPSPAKATRRRRRRSRGLRDFQRAKVYRWEAAHVFPHDRAIMDLDACRALVLEAYRWAEGAAAFAPGWRPPAVTDGRGRRHAAGSRAVIKLPRWARTRPVVLHECAHGLAPDKHGPQFVRVYVDLLERFMGLERASLLTSITAAGIAAAGPAAPVDGVRARAASQSRMARLPVLSQCS